VVVVEVVAVEVVVEVFEEFCDSVIAGTLPSTVLLNLDVAAVTKLKVG
jgi:hypothetical protein